MSDAMVTGRISAEKKARANQVLERCGISASQAINMLYDRLIEEQGVDFLLKEKPLPSRVQWSAAESFIDSLVKPLSGPFVGMTVKEAKGHRLSARGLM